MRFAYADPPYLGQGKKHYGLLHEDAADCDTLQWHSDLIQRLSDEFPDGWALSASSSSLWRLMPLLPSDIRIGAWVKPFCSFKPNVNPAYAWEPVVFRGGRKRDREEDTVRDFVSCPITLKTGVPGAKPNEFCFWVFRLLNAIPSQDEFIDLFQGSGNVSHAWEIWKEECRQLRLLV